MLAMIRTDRITKMGHIVETQLDSTIPSCLRLMLTISITTISLVADQIY